MFCLWLRNDLQEIFIIGKCIRLVRTNHLSTYNDSFFLINVEFIEKYGDQRFFSRPSQTFPPTHFLVNF